MFNQLGDLLYAEAPFDNPKVSRASIGITCDFELKIPIYYAQNEQGFVELANTAMINHHHFLNVYELAMSVMKA